MKKWLLFLTLTAVMALSSCKKGGEYLVEMDLESSTTASATYKGKCQGISVTFNVLPLILTIKMDGTLVGEGNFTTQSGDYSDGKASVLILKRWASSDDSSDIVGKSIMGNARALVTCSRMTTVQISGGTFEIDLADIGLADAVDNYAH